MIINTNFSKVAYDISNFSTTSTTFVVLLDYVGKGCINLQIGNTTTTTTRTAYYNIWIDGILVINNLSFQRRHATWEEIVFHSSLRIEARTSNAGTPAECLIEWYNPIFVEKLQKDEKNSEYTFTRITGTTALNNVISLTGRGYINLSISKNGTSGNGSHRCILDDIQFGVKYFGVVNTSTILNSKEKYYFNDKFSLNITSISIGTWFVEAIYKLY